MSGVPTQDKHCVPDGKLLERNKSNTFQVINDLVQNFMNFNVLKIFQKFIKKKNSLRPGTYMQDNKSQRH